MCRFQALEAGRELKRSAMRRAPDRLPGALIDCVSDAAVVTVLPTCRLRSTRRADFVADWWLRHQVGIDGGEVGLGQHVEDVSDEEMERRMAAFYEDAPG